MKKILSRIVMVALIISALFLVSACDMGYQKDVNISGITVKEGTVPETILVGNFDSAGIKLVIAYENDTTEEVSVTSSLIPQAYRSYLNTPGTYRITILYKGYETELNITIVADNFTVNFYDGNGDLISTQKVDRGEDAVAPSGEMEGAVQFVGWDRTYTNVTENINVYGIYISMDITLDEETALQKLSTAENYFVRHDHECQITADNDADFSELIVTHYNSLNERPESQIIVRRDGELQKVYNYFVDKVETMLIGADDTHYYDMTSTFVLDDQSMMRILFDTEAVLSWVFFEYREQLGADYLSVEHSAKLYQSGIIHEVSIILVNDASGSRAVYKYTFDDEKLISIERTVTYTSSNPFDENSQPQTTTSVSSIRISYENVREFDLTLIPESVKH